MIVRARNLKPKGIAMKVIVAIFTAIAIFISFPVFCADIFGEESAESHLMAGKEYYDKSDFGSALSEFNKAISLDPDYSSAYFRKGCVYLVFRQPQMAINCFEKTIQLNPEYAAAYQKMGEAYNLSLIHI